MAKRTRGHSVKQTAKQTQIVNVRIGEVKRKRSKRRRRRSGGGGGESMQLQAPIPLPTVSYQTGYGSFPLIQGQPVMNPFPYSAPAGIPKPVLEDIGQVGTHGREEILVKPTRGEQLSEMVTPISRGADLKAQERENVASYKLDEASFYIDKPMRQFPDIQQYEEPFKKIRPPEPTEGIPLGDYRRGGMEPEPARSSRKGTSKAELAVRYQQRYGKKPPSRMSKSQLMIAVLKPE